MNPTLKVMLLVDADNVSVDVIQQAFDRVMAQHGAIHVRRAYCNAESAARNLGMFKALSMRPIVNVSTGKNSTDIALAVDAISLVEAERPDIVVIVSSDSDFAPLVIRLREKGCRVEGIGQKGKTGEDSVVVYDDFIDLTHRKAPVRASARSGGRGGERNVERAPERAVERAIERAPAPASQRRGGGRTSLPKATPREPEHEMSRELFDEPAPEPMREPREAEPASTKAPAKRGSRSRAAKTAAPAPVAVPTPPPAAVVPAPPPPQRIPEDVMFILEAVPELADGSKVELGIAAERLRNVQMLAKNAPSTKLFKKHLEFFVLTPERQPNKVQYRGPAPW
jgi:uncharacterized protein (TIGR00288 family)